MTRRAPKDEPVEGLQFYELLVADDLFCAQLGRAILAAGRLETALVRYLQQYGSDVANTRATLGKLIRFAEQQSLLTRLLPSLKVLRDQRNYLTHNVHGLFAGVLEETILERTGLLDSDVDTFSERAWQLQENLIGLAEIVERKLAEIA